MQKLFKNINDNFGSLQKTGKPQYRSLRPPSTLKLEAGLS